MDMHPDWAIERNDADEVRALHARKAFDVNSTVWKDQRPMAYRPIGLALYYKADRALQALLDLGSDPSLRCAWRYTALGPTKLTPLGMAMLSYCPATMIAALLVSGAPLDGPFKHEGQKHTPESFARQCGRHAEWIEALRLAGPNVRTIQHLPVVAAASAVDELARACWRTRQV
jgi:hypothetical protein